MASPRTASQHESWLSLGPASRLVGVDPDTLRRWADTGRVPCFLTPGGHRRFAKRSLEHLVRDRSNPRASLTALGATPQRVVAAYRKRYAQGRLTGSVRRSPFPDARVVVPQSERETFRVEGRSLVDALLRFLDASQPGPSSDALAEASLLVEALGTRLARSGVSLVDAVALFVGARQPLLSELRSIGRRRSLGPDRLGELYERASTGLDALLITLVQSHQAAM